MGYVLDRLPFDRSFVIGALLSMASLGLVAYFGFMARSAGDLASFLFGSAVLPVMAFLVVMWLVAALLKIRGPAGLIVGLIVGAYIFAIAVKIALLL